MTARKLVICADGTWNEPEQTDLGMPSLTNVCKLAKAVQPFDQQGVAQIICYHTGVGEHGGLGDHILGGALGAGLSQNIIDCYLFLVLNYFPGDELFLFGFSRGAYTVRSLAGLIRNSGVLKSTYAEKYKEAYALYQNRDRLYHPSASLAVEFRKKYSFPDFNIKFIGVWDTVGSLGIPFSDVHLQRFRFHDVELSSYVDYAYQALAIDEKRKPFAPALWQKQPTSPANQVLEQVWFPGVHCNVGGGYEDSGLADCALEWMWQKAEACGLSLDHNQKPVPNPNGVLRDSMCWYYKPLGSITRILGAQLPNSYEQLSQAALQRMQLNRDYHPKNLEDFLKNNPLLTDLVKATT
jgi:uncharacterized protein (DUF2235 family)